MGQYSVRWCIIVIELLIKCDRDGKNERSVKYSCRIWVLLDQGGVDLGKDCAVEGVSRKQVKETKWEGNVCWVFFCLLKSKSQTKQMIVDNVDDDDRKEGSVGNKVGGKCLVQVAVEGGACTLPCTAEGGVRG